MHLIGALLTALAFAFGGLGGNVPTGLGDTTNVVTFTETFDAYATGPVGGNGGWAAQQGGTRYRISVYGTSLIDGVNSATFHDLGSGTTTFSAVQFNFPAGVDFTAHNYRWTFRVRVNTGAGMSSGTSPQLCLTKGNVDLTNFTTDALDVGFYESSGHVAAVTYDNPNLTARIVTNVGALDTALSVRVELTTAGAYTLFVNNTQQITGNLVTTNKAATAMYLGNFAAPAVSDAIAYDTISLVQL